MDLSSIDTTSVANEGAVLELRGPDESQLRQDNGEPVTITLLGKDSDTFVKLSNANTDRYIKQGARAKMTAAGLKSDATAVLARCTVSWSGIVLNGQALECNQANAVMVYERFPFIREQVDEFIGDRANFSKASPTI